MEDYTKGLFGDSEQREYIMSNIYQEYMLPKESLPKVKTRHKPDSRDAKAKGLYLYQFGEGNTLFARNDKEAIKRAGKKGFDIRLLKKVEQSE